METQYQLWICKTSNWVMIGFFNSPADANDKYATLADGAVTDKKIVEVLINEI